MWISNQSQDGPTVVQGRFPLAPQLGNPLAVPQDQRSSALHIHRGVPSKKKLGWMARGSIDAECVQGVQHSDLIEVLSKMERNEGNMETDEAQETENLTSNQEVERATYHLQALFLNSRHTYVDCCGGPGGELQPDHNNMSDNDTLISDSAVELIQKSGIFAKSVHRMNAVRVKWLYHWLVGSISGAEDFEARLSFLVSNFEAYTYFRPFTTIQEAERIVSRDRSLVVVRLSSSVPGNISISYYGRRRTQRVYHQRYVVNNSGIAPPSNSPYQMSKKCYASLEELVDTFIGTSCMGEVSPSGYVCA